jgi:hypothetical protein
LLLAGKLDCLRAKALVDKADGRHSMREPANGTQDLPLLCGRCGTTLK